MSDEPVNETPKTPRQSLISGRYREIQRIGTGGMSTVVMAEDTTLKRTVALKMLAEHLASDKDFVTRFRNEALAVARLQHPHIVQVFDSGYDKARDQHYIVMEYVEGTPLSEMLRGGRKLDPPQATSIAADACEALECAHRAGVIHRDVKPANLIITRDGAAKLTDFGIAKAAEMTRVTQVGSVLGTVAYLSPEQAVGGETGPQSDIYSLGVVIYEMLAGRLPYLYRSITELAMKQRDETPTPLTAINPEVPVELDRTIRVALSHDANLRFATAREFAQALREGLARRETEFVTTVLSDPAAATRLIASRGRASENPQRRAATRKPLPPMSDPRAAHDEAATAVTRVEPGPAQAHPAQAHPVKSQPKKKTKKAPRILVGLLLAAAVAAAAIAGFTLGESSTAPVVNDTVQGQIEGMRGFIQDHS